MTLGDSQMLHHLHKFSKIVTIFWIRIKRTDRSHRCPAGTNHRKGHMKHASAFGFVLVILVLFLYTLVLFVLWIHFKVTLYNKFCALQKKYPFKGFANRMDNFTSLSAGKFKRIDNKNSGSVLEYN